MNRRNAETVYPLSPMQQGMLFHTLMEPQSGVYCEQLVYELSGSLDISAFKRAWEMVVERHAVFRTLVLWEQVEQPLQVVRERVQLPWDLRDWRSFSEEKQREQFQALIRGDRRRGFTFTKAPLMRLILIQMAEKSFRFVWTYHHLLLDGWSQALVLKEVFSRYEALRQGLEIHREPGRPYRDYITWLHRQDSVSAEAFWRRTLAGFTNPTPLGIDHHQPQAVPKSETSHAGQQIRLSTSTTAALRELARQQRLTLNTLVQGAWALLLSRYSGEQDIVFGMVVSGRPATLPGAEGMIGLFLNTLPMRVHIPEMDTLLPWLREVQQRQIEARQFEYSPLMEIQKWSDVRESTGDRFGKQLFESVVDFMNYPLDAARLEQEGSLQVRALPLPSGRSHPLTLTAEPGYEMGLAALYEQRRFEPAVIGRLLNHLSTLLEGMAANPDQRLVDLPLLPVNERRQILVELNATNTPYPTEQCLHDLFEDRVLEVPQEAAVVFGGEQLSYQELNNRANRLAHYLRRHGVGPEVLVGLHMERSFELVVGLLGILKAGGAYVPLDPGYPLERIAFMLEDAQVSVLLTQQHLLSGLPEHRARAFCLDTDWSMLAGESEENPVSEVTPAMLVYMIYTSGSTGRPKGVLLDHGGRVNNFSDFNRRFSVGRHDRLFALSSPSFDMAAYDIFGILSAGGTAVLPDPSTERDPARWADILIRERVTIWHSVPALLELLVEYISEHPDRAPRSLRLVLLGGDWIPITLADRLRSLLPAAVQVISLGGATEASMDSTIYAIDQQIPGWKSVPYGRPMANQQAVILDSYQRPVPIGITGELHLGGIGLARGYLNCPDLTAEKFIPNPFKEIVGDRLYRTGDLARYRFDERLVSEQEPGVILELLGRRDHQVKIHGVRIELGEIEAVLRQNKAVHDVVVVARAEPVASTGLASPKRLVAYVVPSQGYREQSEHLPNDLRNFLQAHLSDSMIPSALVILDTLPLTPNGKVDRRNLPDPNLVYAQQEETFVAPRTPTEQALAEIWAQVFKVERVGIRDNFFALGGDSIISLRIIARANERGIRLGPKQLFEHQTIAELAKTGTLVPPLEEKQAPSAAPARFSLSRLNKHQLDLLLETNPEIEDIYPLAPMQQHMLFHLRHTPKSGLYVNQMTFPLSGDLNIVAWQQAWQWVVERHAILRTSFVWEGFSVPLQVTHRFVKIALDHQDWRGLSPDEWDEQLQTFLQKERACGFDLSQVPLLRLALIRLGEKRYQSVVSYQYILLDGWSHVTLWKEVFALYTALNRGQELHLDPVVSYRDYIAWIGQQDMAEARRFWQQALSNFTGPTSLPMRQDPLEPQPSYDEQQIRLSRNLTADLQMLARRQQLTLNTLVQGAWALLLSQYSCKREVIFGVTSSGRPAALSGVESIVGLLINTLPVQVHISPSQLLLPWLKELQAQQFMLRQYEYVPLQKIKEWSAIPQTVPLFESALHFSNYPIDISRSQFQDAIAAVDGPKYQASGMTQNELPLRIEAIPEQQLLLSISYYRACFPDSTITQILEHFQSMLIGMVADPQQPLGELLQLIAQSAAGLFSQ